MGKSVVISFRLFADDEREGLVLAQFERLKNDGFTVRDIVTDAVLNRAGFKPQMFRSRGDMPHISISQDDVRKAVKMELSELETLLTEFMQEIKQSIRRGGVTLSADESADEKIDLDETQQALVRSFLARKGRR